MALEKRSVTSSLIFTFPDDDESQRPRLALFRRSSRVRTYRGKYGLISGSIEASDPSPLACAWRELGEETGLSCPALELMRHGRPFTFRDAGVGREWTVYPFMFKLEAARAGDIRIDWEHDGYEWVDPADVRDGQGFALEGVPRLVQSLRSVWFDADLGERAGGVLARGLRELRGDYESGARELAARAAGIYGSTLQALDERDGEAWWRSARLAGWHLWKNGRESMGASIANLVLGVLAAIEERRGSGGAGELSLGRCAREAVQEVSRVGGDAGRRMGEAFRAVLREQAGAPRSEDDVVIRVLTLSSSSTVTACLADALAAADSPWALDIRVLESRPLFEGVKTARCLAAHAAAAAAAAASRSKVTVYTDASAAIAARDVQLVLLGADIIDGRTARVSNKTGSLPAVLAARHVSPRCRVVVVSETAKVLPFDAPGEEERSNVKEMTSSWHGPDSDSETGFAVENILFEWVDAALVDCFVTERGVLTAAGISQRAEEIKRGADRFFVDI